NESIPVIIYIDFHPVDYPDRNVIIVGKKDNNAAWDSLLAVCHIQISDGQARIGEVAVSGDQWGTYFIYPRPDSEVASVGVVSSTGKPGMKAAFDDAYLENDTTLPYLLLYDEEVLTRGNASV